MLELNKQEMLEIDGGLDISGTLIEALLKTSEFYYNMGKSFGSNIRKLLGVSKIRI